MMATPTELRKLLKEEATLRHLGKTIEAKDQMGLVNFGLGGISPPSILEGDLELVETWRRVIKATSQRLTAMAVMSIKAQAERMKLKIAEEKGKVPEAIALILEEHQKILNTRMKGTQIRKLCRSLESGNRLKPVNQARPSFPILTINETGHIHKTELHHILPPNPTRTPVIYSTQTHRHRHQRSHS